MAAVKTGLRKKSPSRTDFEMRTRSWYTTRPDPRFRCPTSEFPIWPAGSPTRSSDAWIRVRGNRAHSWSKNGVSARATAFPSFSSRWPQPSMMIRATNGRFILEIIEHSSPVEPGCRAEFLLDPEQLVVLRDPVGPRSGAGLDLSRGEPDDEIRDRAVLGLAGSMGHDGGPPCALRHLDRLDRFRHGADLVQLDEHGVGDALRDPLPQDRRIGDEDVIPHDLDLLSQRVREHLPAFPVILGETVLDRHDRVLAAKVLVERDELRGVPLRLVG